MKPERNSLRQFDPRDIPTIEVLGIEDHELG
jgi:hypothetical protein